MALDTTVPGGRYIGTDGRLHDAHGRLIADPFPADDLGDLPAAAILRAAGYTTRAAVAATADADLLALDGIGPATLRQIREALDAGAE